MIGGKRRKEVETPRQTGKYWAIWWGISLGLTFSAAATISFSFLDRGTQIASTVGYAVHQKPAQ
jgi:hypothetical protein